MPTRMVIIGGGLTAATAAEELRERGFDGTIDLVTAEAHRPCQRLPLSKGYLAGTENLDSVFAHAEGWESEHRVTLHEGNAAQRLADHAVELAAAARGYGNDVTMVMRESIPLAAVLGHEMGTVFRELHEAHGVVFLQERETLEIEVDANGSATGVRTSQDTVPADLVIVGVGAVPETALAEAAGLDVNRGIHC